ncbi:MAG: hypothetical protein LC749_09720, partial [Actinobacteria bacterium]|nr:hypothetical protein [Actinomycetota bacterium]
RAYNLIPVAGALWSLRGACQEWLEAMDLATRSEIVLMHAGRGKQDVADVARNNAHDAYHHEWDIGRTLERAGALVP